MVLGRPHLLFLPGGVIQLQSLYEGSRGPGAARLLGVTAYLNGRAGLGPDNESAVRQALNRPPRIHVRPPSGVVVVGEPVELTFRVENADREIVTITAPDGETRDTLDVDRGRGTVRWVPSVAGPVRVRVDVHGLDGTDVAGSTTFRVLDRPPRLWVTDKQDRVVAGDPVRIAFRVKNAIDETAEISTRAGIVLTRHYQIREGVGVVEWTPEAPGPAVLLLRTRGHQGQVATERVRMDVQPTDRLPPPIVVLVRVPDAPTVDQPAAVAFQADGCRVALVRIEGLDDVRTWRFPCPADPGRFTWIPTTPGQHVITAVARQDGTTSTASVRLRVVESQDTP